jgi:drug/metabolite transporter (DMT)-like permease
MSKSNLSTYAMLFLGMAFFGSATPISKIVTEHFPVFIAGGIRVLMAFLVLLPFVKMGKIKDFKGKDLWLLIGIALIGVLGFTALMLYGMKMVSGVAGSIVMGTTPAITAGLSFLVFHDKFGWRKALAIGLAVAGIILLHFGDFSSEGGQNEILGIILVLAAVFCEAGYTLMGKALTKDFSPVSVAAFTALIGFLAFVPPAVWQYEPGFYQNIPQKAWMALGWYGIGTMGIGSVLWYKGIQKVEGSTAAGFMGIMPLSALVLSYILLGEKFRWIHLAGFGLVFVGVILIVSVHRGMSIKEEKKKEKR